MNSRPDAERSRLRAVVATIDGEMSRLPSPLDTDDNSTTTTGLRASWADLVALLELGPEPEVRQCLACKQVVMHAATRCGWCWTKLTPPGGPGRVILHGRGS